MKQLLHATSEIFQQEMPRPYFSLLRESEDPSDGTTDNNSIKYLQVPTCHVIDEANRITGDTLARLLLNPMSYGFDYIIIVDTRFTYEYLGGHITGAINVTTMKQLYDLFKKYEKRRVCIVFHCEYSKERSMKVLQAFRNIDRTEHFQEYPTLTYPYIFLLDKGYKNFHKEFPKLCTGSYVQMRDSKFVENGELRKCHSKYINEFEKKPEDSIEICPSSTICIFGDEKNPTSVLDSYPFPKACSQPVHV